MLSFLSPKTKIKYDYIKEIPIEDFEVIGIGQINPYFKRTNPQFQSENFVTVVNIFKDDKDCDEKEGLILSDYFTLRKCPNCGHIQLLPTRIRLNLNNVNKYRHEFNTMILAYCNSCSACYHLGVSKNDLWLKEAKKIKEKDLITKAWEKYCIE